MKHLLLYYNKHDPPTIGEHRYLLYMMVQTTVIKLRS